MNHNSSQSESYQTTKDLDNVPKFQEKTRQVKSEKAI
jgi:hypothetical protein